MKTIRVRIPSEDNAPQYVVPVQIPALAEVREYANVLHLRSETYQGQKWGWPVHYEPEIIEERALFERPNEGNGMKKERRSHYSPASFTVSESGIWRNCWKRRWICLRAALSTESLCSATLSKRI